MLCEVSKYYECGELEGRYEGLSGPLLKCVLSCVSRESPECMSRKSPECMSRESSECEFDEKSVLEYVCPPKGKMKIEDYKINWMFKEYYEEIVIRPDLNFKIPSNPSRP